MQIELALLISCHSKRCSESANASLVKKLWRQFQFCDSAWEKLLASVKIGRCTWTNTFCLVSKYSITMISICISSKWIEGGTKLSTTHIPVNFRALQIDGFMTSFTVALNPEWASLWTASKAGRINTGRMYVRTEDVKQSQINRSSIPGRLTFCNRSIQCKLVSSSSVFWVSAIATV